MSRIRNTPILIAISSLFITAWCATNALASLTLTNIPLVTHDVGATDTRNEGRAISPDGRWVVGLQGTNNMSYATNGTAGILYDVATTKLRCDIIDSTPSSYCAIMSGVGYRAYDGTNELVMSGGNSGWNADWMTPDGGATWGLKRRDTTVGSKPAAVLVNALAGGATDVFYQVWMDQPSGDNGLWVGQFSGVWPMTPVWDHKQVPAGTKCGLWGVSATGRAVGFRRNLNVTGDAVYIGDWNGLGTPTMWQFTTLDGSVGGQAFSVSADGTIIFGFSPVSDPFTRPGNWPFKAVVGAATPAGGSTTNGISVNELPTCPDNGGSTSQGIPYGCTADGKYAVGMSYRGTEKATLWDTSDPDPTKWKLTDLTDLASANGMLDIFTRLYRAYSVGTNGAGDPVITGVGVETNLATRAFVMTVPKSIAAVGFWLPPKPRLTISGSFGSYTLSYPSTLGTTNYVEYTTNISPVSTWTTISTDVGTGTTIYVYDTSPAEPQRFYRVRVAH